MNSFLKTDDHKMSLKEEKFMLLETWKIVSSIWPFVKEVFLWRDGAEAGKPVTRQNLIRRKIAVFVLIASIGLNYFIGGKAVDLYRKHQTDEKQIRSLTDEVDRLKQQPQDCVHQKDLDLIMKRQIELSKQKTQ